MADQQRTSQGERSRARQSMIPSSRQQGLARRDPFFDIWDQPFGLLRRFSSDLDRLFGAPFGDVGESGAMMTSWQPNIDVFRRGNDLVVHADLPGMNRDDINVEITDDEIILQGERREEREENREDVYMSERRYGSFRRVIPLPEGSDAQNPRANFRNGTLEIVVPMTEEASRPRSRRVEIGEGEAQAQPQGQPAQTGREQQERPAAARTAGASTSR